jgi:ABC-type multidrug transport system fused ATPase/permease subunit
VCTQVDAAVGTIIFEKGVQDFVSRGGSALLAINQLALARSCDHLVFLSGGVISAQGTFEQMMTSDNQEFSMLIKKHASVDRVDDAVAAAASAVTTTATVAATIGDPVLRTGTDVASEEAAEVSDDEIELLVPPTKNDNAQAPHSKHEQGERSETGAPPPTARGNVYYKFFQAMGWPSSVVYGLLLVTCYAILGTCDFWTTLWIGAAQAMDVDEANFYRWTYGALSLGLLLLALFVGWFFARATVSASKTLHHQTISKVLFAPLAWHLDNPSGNIISRFSADLLKVDLFVSYYTDVALQIVAQTAVLVIVICLTLPPTIPFCLLSGWFYWQQVKMVDAAQRPLKRAANDAVAPIITNLNETLAGRELIRVMQCEQFFLSRHHTAVNEFTRNDYMSSSILNWGNVLAGYIGVLLSLAAATFAVAMRKDYDSEHLALALTYCFIVPMYASFIGQVCNMVAMFYQSLERLLEYLHVPQEPPRTVPADEKLFEGWPSAGAIHFQAASLRYKPTLPEVLSAVELKIAAGEHVGIVGRTGAGKSSLVALLFRLVEPSAGSVTIDGVDIASVGLKRLRSAIAIVPQDPCALVIASQSHRPFWSSLVGLTSQMTEQLR